MLYKNILLTLFLITLTSMSSYAIQSNIITPPPQKSSDWVADISKEVEEGQKNVVKDNTPLTHGEFKDIVYLWSFGTLRHLRELTQGGPILWGKNINQVPLSDFIASINPFVYNKQLSGGSYNDVPMKDEIQKLKADNQRLKLLVSELINRNFLRVDQTKKELLLIDPEYNLIFVESLPKENALISENTLYLQKSGDALKYTVLDPNRKRVTGVINSIVTQENRPIQPASLTPDDLQDIYYKLQILKFTSRKGHTRKLESLF